MSGSAPVALGAGPRADLMPAEVRARSRDGATRTLAILALLGAVLIAAAGGGASYLSAASAQQALADAQTRSADLIAEQSQYLDVRFAEQQIGAVQAAQRVATAPDVDWTALLGRVASVLPGGVAIVGANAESASPITAYAQPTAPLQGERLGRVQLALRSPSGFDLASIVGALATIPGVTDVVPASVVDSEGMFTLDVSIYLDADALSGRFALDDDAESEAEAGTSDAQGSAETPAAEGVVP